MTWRNLSSLNEPAAAQARGAFDSALRESGGRPAESTVADAQVTISENESAFLLVEEFKRADERQVWIASWRRGPVDSAGATSASIEKKLVWEQDEPILDVAVLPDSLLILTPSALIRSAPRQSAPIAWQKPWPRDVRGRLRVKGGVIEARLPGASCGGTMEPLAIACKASDEPWPLDSGGRALLLATFASNRNYFDGRVVTQSGARKTVPPFYSAASADSFWILATADGRASIFDGAMEPAGNAGTWGSDLANSDARCGGAPVALASRPGDGPDAVQAYALVNRSAVPIGKPVEMPGPVTALWTPGIAVARNGSSWQAYAIAVHCAQ